MIRSLIVPEHDRNAELATIKTAVESIAIANGFDRDVVRVYREVPNPDSIKDDSVVIVPTDDVVIEEDININVREWTVVIAGYVKDRNKLSEVEKFKDQIMKGLRDQVPAATDPIFYRHIGTIDPSTLAEEFDAASFTIAYDVRYFENLQ